MCLRSCRPSVTGQLQHQQPRTHNHARHILQTRFHSSTTRADAAKAALQGTHKRDSSPTLAGRLRLRQKPLHRHRNHASTTRPPPSQKASSAPSTRTYKCGRSTRVTPSTRSRSSSIYRRLQPRRASVAEGELVRPPHRWRRCEGSKQHTLGKGTKQKDVGKGGEGGGSVPASRGEEEEAQSSPR